MSGICGIFNLDGCPVNFEVLRQMNDVMPHLGSDNTGVWARGAVGLGHRMLWTTSESLQEIQPLSDESGKICLVFDGRVDNRGELKKSLGTCGARIRDHTDAELILQAYKCWGEGCCTRIIGDFAFVIWDGFLQQLLCARDFLGMRPFYYYKDGESFIFGTELRQLFEHPAVHRLVNEGMIGEYIAASIVDIEETLYQNVYRLPAAHFLIVKPGRCLKKRYWNIDPTKKIYHSTDQEYAEHFLGIFKEAVRCRLRSYGPVAAELSGGLDSSSIVAVAQDEFTLAVGGDTNLSTFSLVFPGLACDESAYIRSVTNKFGLQSNEMQPGCPELDWFNDQVSDYMDFPWYPHGYGWYQLRSLARKKGYRVVLSGAGGDEWFTGSAYHYADYLRQFNLRQLIRQMRCDRQFKVGSLVPAITLSAMPLLRYGLFPLIPSPVRQFLKWGLGRKRALPAWINKDFADRIRLAERLQNKGEKLDFPSFSQQAICGQLTSGWLFNGNELAAHSTASLGMDIRFPFMDQRIVEFALALPESQRWRCEWTKFVLRYSMQGMLPEEVRQRRTKADFSHMFAETLINLGGEQLFESLTVAKIGWVDVSQTKRMYREMFDLYTRGNLQYINHVWELWMIFGIELWVKKNFPSYGAGTPYMME